MHILQISESSFKFPLIGNLYHKAVQVVLGYIHLFFKKFNYRYCRSILYTGMLFAGRIRKDLEKDPD